MPNFSQLKTPAHSEFYKAEGVACDERNTVTSREQGQQNQPQLYHRKHEPTVAPGLEDDELNENATDNEVEQGDYTMVTQLSLDEHDNGSDD